MKVRIGVMAALLCITASLGFAIQVPEQSITTISVVNEDRIPHSIIIDQNNHTIQVFAAGGGTTTLPPGQDVAMRAGRGSWRIYGDSGRELRIRMEYGHDYKLHLRPYSHGDVRTLVGIIDDGYSHFDAPLVDMRRHPHMDEYPPNYYDPRYHDPLPPGTPSYPYAPVDTHESLGQAIHQAFDDFLHNVADQQQPADTTHPYYVPQQSNPWQ